MDVVGWVVQFGYDEVYWLVSLIDENCEIYCFQYDCCDFVFVQIGFDGYKCVYEYDVCG